MATFKLNAGDPAPAFSGKSQDGSVVSLSDFYGRRLALYFYPKDDTPGCTAQACSIRDNFSSMKEQNVTVIGISADTEISHQKFIAKYELPFPLLADNDHTISEAYGVWVEKNNYGKKYMGIARTTFLINDQGIIQHIIRKVDTARAAAQMLELLAT